MSHFAKLDENDIVVKVHVVNNSEVPTEQTGIEFLQKIHKTIDTFVQTSYNTNHGKHFDSDTREEDGGTSLRKNYARVGSHYDKTRDAFYIQQPYPSWTLNEETCLWDSPVSYPNDGKEYLWNEDTTSWDEITK
jgi:hypothetical protein